ncbi:hypothetical protein RND81_01G007300 [Saponaria officinalis]|uniref:Uncharacterized protein n=1 Tax=Saponaria officinalis TaxID=3572 RepID=A0AAW1NBP5_SAPOF
MGGYYQNRLYFINYCLLVGLKRTGKSCRLRWVNYLHPGLKRGKMTPNEEKLILELHSQCGNRYELEHSTVKFNHFNTLIISCWHCSHNRLHSKTGNLLMNKCRWSRIARRLPGRTDNEIKNYWRTHMRKQAQEKKREISPSSSSLMNSSISSDSAAVNSMSNTETSSMFHSTEAPDRSALREKKHKKDENKKEEEFYSMDDIWKDITSDEDQIIPFSEGYSEESFLTCPPMASPLWEYCPDTFWRLEEDGSKILFSSNDMFSYQDENVSNL